MHLVTFDEIRAAYQNAMYAFFEGDDYDLNIGGIRSNDLTADTFNDLFFVVWKAAGDWNMIQTPCTTDPGVYYRQNPLNVRGTAIMRPGQYRSAYQLGFHRGKYRALTQAAPIEFWRVQPDFWQRLDAGEVSYIDMHEWDKAVIGANIHRASELRRSVRIGKWSAACQVIPDPDVFDLIISLAQRQVEHGHGTTFTYTLFTEASF